MRLVAIIEKLEAAGQRATWGPIYREFGGSTRTLSTTISRAIEKGLVEKTDPLPRPDCRRGRPGAVYRICAKGERRRRFLSLCSDAVRGLDGYESTGEPRHLLDPLDRLAQSLGPIRRGRGRPHHSLVVLPDGRTRRGRRILLKDREAAAWSDWIDLRHGGARG
jgi:hypothetical protein